MAAMLIARTRTPSPAPHHVIGRRRQQPTGSSNTMYFVLSSGEFADSSGDHSSISRSSLTDIPEVEAQWLPDLVHKFLTPACGGLHKFFGRRKEHRSSSSMPSRPSDLARHHKNSIKCRGAPGSMATSCMSPRTHPLPPCDWPPPKLPQQHQVQQGLSEHALVRCGSSGPVTPASRRYHTTTLAAT